MFIEDNCILCGHCFNSCHWIDADDNQAIQWMEEIIEGTRSEVLDRCVTCYACNETCPQDANPYDRIAELQDKYRTLSSIETVNDLEEKFIFTRSVDPPPKAKRVMSLCVLENGHPELIQGELYDIERVAGKPYFCWVMLGHLGAISVQKKHAQTFVDRLAATGADEIVCLHDDCYTMLAREAPEFGVEVPFKPIHFSQYLVEYLTENRDRITPLDIDIAYQRPCASRLTPEKEHYIDELFDLTGVRRVKRTFDRDNAMCCGGAKFMLQKGDITPDQIKNLTDAKQAGAQALVGLCPVCLQSFTYTARSMEMPLIFLGDIARMALGEIKVPT